MGGGGGGGGGGKRRDPRNEVVQRAVEIRIPRVPEAILARAIECLIFLLYFAPRDFSRLVSISRAARKPLVPREDDLMYSRLSNIKASNCSVVKLSESTSQPVAGARLKFCVSSKRSRNEVRRKSLLEMQ